jgi:hypothetical protein
MLMFLLMNVVCMAMSCTVHLSRINTAAVIAACEWEGRAFVLAAAITKTTMFARRHLRLGAREEAALLSD